MPEQSRPFTGRTIDGLRGPRWNEWRELRKLGPRMAEYSQLRVRNSDQLKIERLVSVERHHSPIRHSDPEITIPIIRDRQDCQLLGDMM